MKTKSKFFLVNFSTTQGMEAEKSIQIPAVEGFEAAKREAQKIANKKASVYTFTICDPQGAITDFSYSGNPIGNRRA